MHSLFVQTEVKLCSEFYRRCCFASHDRTDIWLTDVYNSVRNGMHPVVIHVLLLFIDLFYDSQSRGLFRSQLTFLFQKFIEIFPISLDVLELLLDRFAVRFLHFARFR